LEDGFRRDHPKQPSPARMAVLADRKLAGSGITPNVEKFPLFVAVKLVKPAPLCAGTIPVNASDAAPCVVKVEPDPPIAAMIWEFVDVRVTVTGLPPAVVPLEALNPPAMPFALRVPFVITALRKRLPVPPGPVVIRIVPLKPC